jgi:hypothetical protein
VAGLFLGALLGRLVGLPASNLISDAADEGFDQLDLGLCFAFVAWIVGALLAGRVAHRRLGGAKLGLPVAAAVMAVLGGSTTAVGSATADWYHPLIVFGAPMVVVGVLSGREPRLSRAASE